jgi:MFS family permease
MPDLTPIESPESQPGSSTEFPPVRSSFPALRKGLIAFQYRNYRLLWFGQLISVTGTWMQSLAQAWLVYEILNANAFQLGLVNVLQFLPVLLFGIPCGIIADRFPKRSIMLVTQFIMMILAATMSALVFTNVVELWMVYVIATIFGMANAVDMPTRQAFVSDLVGREAIMNAVALNSALFNTGRIVGPAIAGILLGLFGPAVLFGINAASYIAVLAGLAMIRIAPVINLSTDSPIQRLRDGLSYVRSTPTIMRTIILVGTVGTFGMNFNVWIPVLASDYFEAGSNAYGLLFSAMGVGSLIGALSLAFSGRGPNHKRMLAGVAVMGVSEIALAFVANSGAALAMGAVTLAFIGFSASNAMSTANTTVQTTSDDGHRGRVMAVYMTVFAGSIPIGALISGWVTNQFGAPTSVAMGGTIVLLMALVQFRVPQRAPSTTSQVSPSADARAHS